MRINGAEKLTTNPLIKGRPCSPLTHSGPEGGHNTEQSQTSHRNKFFIHFCDREVEMATAKFEHGDFKSAIQQKKAYASHVEHRGKTHLENCWI